MHSVVCIEGVYFGVLKMFVDWRDWHLALRETYCSNSKDSSLGIELNLTYIRK